MNNPALVKMLEKYDLSSKDGSYDALREILQEIVLLGLYDSGFFNYAAFYGDTALRILHKLPRFSEDLDFSLLKSNPDFNLRPFQEAIVTTLNSYGFDVEIEIKEQRGDSAIASAFIKGNTIKNLLNIKAPSVVTDRIARSQHIKIKLEIDVNPPLSFETENIIKLTPRAFSINTFTLPCLFAGKMHAIICRAWGNRPKGRDWYDLVWYLGQEVELDLVHLEARLKQSCKYLENEDILIPTVLTEKNIKELLSYRILSLDVAKAKDDVQAFIQDKRELDLWSTDFFITIIDNLKIKQY